MRTGQFIRNIQEIFAWYLLSYSEVKKLLEEENVFLDVYNTYWNRFMGNIFECVQGSVMIDSKQRTKVLCEICENIEVKNCLQNYKATSFRMKGICFGIRIKSPIFLTLYIRIYRCMSWTKHKMLHLIWRGSL